MSRFGSRLCQATIPSARVIYASEYRENNASDPFAILKRVYRYFVDAAVVMNPHLGDMAVKITA